MFENLADVELGQVNILGNINTSSQRL